MKVAVLYALLLSLCLARFGTCEFLAPTLVWTNVPMQESVYQTANAPKIEKLIKDGTSKGSVIIFNYEGLTSGQFYKEAGSLNSSSTEAPLKSLKTLFQAAPYQVTFPLSEDGVMNLKVSQLDNKKMIEEYMKESHADVGVVHLSKTNAKELLESASVKANNVVFIFTPLSIGSPVKVDKQVQAEPQVQDSELPLSESSAVFAENAQLLAVARRLQAIESPGSLGFEPLQAPDPAAYDIIRTTPFHFASTIYFFVFIAVAIVGVSCLNDVSTPAMFEHRTLDINKEY